MKVALPLVFLCALVPVAKAADLFTPALPANSAQFQECRIVNVSSSPKKVVTEAFNSTGASSSGAYAQTLAPGEAGGFSLSGIYASMYCKFTVKGGSTSDVRGSIDVLDPSVTPTAIVVSLPAT